LVGAQGAEDTSGQVVGLGGSSDAAGAQEGPGGPGSGVRRFTGNQGAVVNLNEEEMGRNPQEFGSQVVGLGVGLNNLPDQASGNQESKSKKKGRGRRDIPAGGPSLRGPSAPTESTNQDTQTSENIPGVASGLDAVSPDQGVQPDISTVGVIGNAQSPQERTERTVQNKPGVDRRQQQEVVPQGIADTLPAQAQDQSMARFQRFEQSQAPRQENPARNDPEGYGATAFNLPGLPGRPRVPRDSGEDERGSDNRSARDLYGYGQRENPIASGTELLFGGQQRRSQSRDTNKKEENRYDPFSL